MATEHLVWLRNDLRLDDNPALTQAQQQGPIRVVFCATPGQWQQHHESQARIGLRAAVISDINEQLAKLGIRFDILDADFFDNIPEFLATFCQRNQIQHIWFNAETPIDEYRRDEAVTKRLSQQGVMTHNCGYDLFVASPVLTKQNSPFKVFTPFYKQWLTQLEADQKYPYPSLQPQGPSLSTQPLPLTWDYAYRHDIWPAQEHVVLARLSAFCERRLQHYAKDRDYPALPATSNLSPYFANGQIGPRRCLHTIQFYCAQSGENWRDNVWLKELAWRDFYRQLLLYFPRISMEKPFQLATEKVNWRDDQAAFTAWCMGQTGFPIVDAAMRQLRQTGWMHNRLRMITASFLCKLLFIDWRRGEQFFMENLIDGEFAANNGGWQWSASTGCDAVPYFRVFNPTRQSASFDPEGKFIRRLVPELRHIDNNHIHDPPLSLRRQSGYPNPIIDYKLARKRAIAAFKAIR